MEELPTYSRLNGLPFSSAFLFSATDELEAATSRSGTASFGTYKGKNCSKGHLIFVLPAL